MELVGKKMIDEFDDVYRLKNLRGANAGNVLGGQKPHPFQGHSGDKGGRGDSLYDFFPKNEF